MPRNVEIKARVADPEALAARARALAGGAEPELLVQRDVFFAVPRGRLKLRTFADGAGELIQYERPDAAGPKTSTYRRLPVPDPAAAEALLAAALGVRGVVRKERRLLRVGQTRVHLDAVEGLGSFLELEVVLRPDQPEAEGVRIARELLARLGVAAEQLVRGAYVDLGEAAVRSSSRS